MWRISEIRSRQFLGFERSAINGLPSLVVTGEKRTSCL